MKDKESFLARVGPCAVIGKLYKNKTKIFLKKFKRVGGLSPYLLKDFLKKIPDIYEDVIGVYVDDKGELAPLHCKGWVLAPRKNDRSDDGLELNG